jgi:hypothetical protein
LNESRVRARRGAGDEAEIGVVRVATDCVWRAKLRAIEKVKKLHSCFDSRPSVRTEEEPFEDCEVKVVYAVRT